MSRKVSAQKRTVSEHSSLLRTHSNDLAQNLGVSHGSGTSRRPGNLRGTDVQSRGQYDPTEEEEQAIEDEAETANETSSLIRHETHNSIASGRKKQFAGDPVMRKRMKYLFPAISIGIFLSAADQTLVVSSFTRIGSDLNDLTKISWITTAYLLTITSFQPFYGRLSDIFGRKSCLLWAYTIFALGSLGCGLARTINDLIASRAIQGIGGAGMSMLVSVILSDVIPLKERGQWQGYINIIFAAGAATGAPMGGLLSDSIGWRWGFLFQPPLCLTAFVLVFFLYKENSNTDEESESESDNDDDLNAPSKTRSRWIAKLKRIDYAGAIVLISAVITLLIGLDRGSNVSWNSIECLVPLCLSFPLMAAFLFVEFRIAKEPIVPKRIVLERTLFSCYLCNFFLFGAYFGVIYYVPLYLQAAKGHTATQAGLMMIPCSISSVSGSLSSGFIMRKTGKYYWLGVTAFAFAFVGILSILLTAGLVANTDAGVIVSTCVMGFSLGTGVTTSLIALKREDQAVATGAYYLFRSLGSTSGLSLAASVFNQTLRSRLQEELRNGDNIDKIIEGVRQSLGYLQKLSPQMQVIVRHCYAEGTRASFGFSVGVSLGATIAAWFVRERALSQ